MVCGGALALTVVLAVLGRLYWNDERLRELVERLGSDKLKAAVTLEALDVELTHHLELRGLRVGPPTGFSQDFLKVRRLAVVWSPLDLLRLRVVLPELACEGVELVLEENDTGQNLKALLAAMAGPPKPGLSAPPTPKAEAKPLTQPSLPLRVEMPRILFSLDKLTILKPGQRLTVDHLGLEGRFAGEGQSVDVALWAGMGDRKEGGSASHFTMIGGKPFAKIDSEQRLGMTLTSSGLGDLGLAATWQGTTTVSADRVLPPLQSSLAFVTQTDLLKQTFDLSRLTMALGKRTQAEMALEVTGILGERQVAVHTLSARSDLDELAPLLAVLMPTIAIGGEVTLAAEPFTTGVTPADWPALAGIFRMTTRRFHVELAQSKAFGIDAEMSVRMTQGIATTDLTGSIREAEAGVSKATATRLKMSVTTPVAPFLGGAPEGDIAMGMRLDVGEASAGTSRARNTVFTMDAVLPVALIKKVPEAPSWRAKMRLDVGDATAGTMRAVGTRSTLTLSSRDLKAEQISLTFVGTIDRMEMPQGEETLVLPNTYFGTTIDRTGQRFTIHKMEYTAAETLVAKMHGVIDQAITAAPVFTGLRLDLGPVDVAKAIALLPPGKRMAGTVAGRMSMLMSIEGRVPYKELLPKTKAPGVKLLPDRSNLAEVLGAYATFLEDWQREFAAGLPLSATVAFLLKDGVFINDKNDAHGITMASEFRLEPHQPVFTWTLDIAELTQPLHASGLHTGFEFSWNDGVMRAAYDASVATLTRDNLPKPLVDARMEAVCRYRLGGDLLFDVFRMEAPDLGFLLDASGVWVKPWQLATNDGLHQPNLPGLDTTLRWSLALNPGERRPLTVGGPELGGGLALSGSLRAADGVIALEGLFATEHFSFVSGSNAVEEMSGGIPFDIRMAFDPRLEATVLRRNFALGGGVFALLTSGEDIRKRPARPTYYERIQPYRDRPGLRARRIKSGSYELDDFVLEGRLTNGMLLADAIAMHVLGGDLVGNMAFQIGRDASVRGDMAFKVSNMDASYFKDLRLEPGPDSELSADMQVGFLFAPKSRDITLNMNITKIGAETFDRFLQILDPKAQDEKLQANRRNLRYVRIDNVAMWMRYEALNMDLAVTTFLRIPGTQIGFPKIDRELLRRYSLSDRLDDIVAPIKNNTLAPALGWNRAN